MARANKNRLGNIRNEFQGSHTKILSVCSAGMLRSPTIANVLIRDFNNVNVRSAGTSEEYALIPVDQVLLSWAEVIICANSNNYMVILDLLEEFGIHNNKIIDLQIEDNYNYGDPKLEEIIRRRLLHFLDLGYLKRNTFIVKDPVPEFIEVENEIQ